MRRYFSTLPSLPRRRELSRGRSLFWVPGFAGMIGALCIGCSNTLPDQEFNGEIVEIEAAPLPIKPKTSFKKLDERHTKELLSSSRIAISKRLLQSETIKSGMSEVFVDKEIRKLGYNFKLQNLGIGSPTVVNSDMSCQKRKSSKLVTYYKTEENENNGTMETLVVWFGGLLVDGNCVNGLMKTPEIRIYEKKHNAKNK